MKRELGSFPSAYQELVSYVATTDESVVIPMNTPQEALSLKAKFNAWKSALKRAGRADDLAQAQYVVCIMENTPDGKYQLRFMPRNQSWESKVVREALSKVGVVPIRQPEEDTSVLPESVRRLFSEPPASNPVECWVCRQVFSSPEELIAHIKEDSHRDRD